MSVESSCGKISGSSNLKSNVACLPAKNRCGLDTFRQDIRFGTKRRWTYRMGPEILSTAQGRGIACCEAGHTRVSCQTAHLRYAEEGALTSSGRGAVREKYFWWRWGRKMPPEWIHSNNEDSMPLQSSSVDSPVEQFDACLRQLVGPARHEKWFAGRTVVSIEDDMIVVGLASPFMLKWMVKEFQAVATEAARQCLGLSAYVRFDVDARATLLQQGTLQENSAAAASDSRSVGPATLRFTPQSTLVEIAETGTAEFQSAGAARGEPVSAPKSKLAPRRRRFARLDDFVTGPGNHVAHSMAQIVAENPGEKYNPLYFYGSVGIGKTHLLEGIHTETRLRYPELTVTYLTAEAFVNYYTKALREKTLPAFRRRFRSIDVLLVDDIEFLDSKKGIQEEFCHTIQDLLTYNRQVVLAADRHPRMLTNVRQDLCTRFLSGLVTRLEAPDELTRREIVRRQIQKMALPVSEDAVEHIAGKFSRNVRELLGAVNCLRTYHDLTKKTIGITATRDVLRNLERDCLRIVKTSDIQHAVCELFGVPQQDLVSEKRTRQLSQPRMLAMYLSRQWTQSAYHEIGQQFGGRNHSTVMSAERKMKEMLKKNTPIQIASREWTPQELIAMLGEQLQVG